MNTILIVEDNENNLMLVRDVLQFKGYRTLEAMTGADGIRIAREAHPDLILLDIQLPDLDGISVLKQIRADATLSSTPVIAISASVMPDDQRKISDSGFDAYLPKPINVKSFVKLVENTLARAVGKAQ